MWVWCGHPVGQPNERPSLRFGLGGARPEEKFYYPPEAAFATRSRLSEWIRSLSGGFLSGLLKGFPKRVGTAPDDERDLCVVGTLSSTATTPIQLVHAG